MTAPLKVLHVSESNQWSGGAAQLLALAAGLKAKGWQCRVVCRPGSGLSTAAAAADLPIFHLPIRQDYDLLSAWKLARFVKSEGIAVLHSHHSRSHGVCLLAKLLLKLSGRRVALVVSRRVSFAVGKNPFSALKYRSRLIDSYVAVAEAVKDVLVKSGVDPARIAVIRSGVDVSRFSPRPPDPAIVRELGLPKDTPVIGKIANAAPWKGQTIFLEAAAILVGKGRKVHFLLAGRDTMGTWIREQVAQFGLAKHVTLAGFRKDVPDILPCLAVSVNAAVGGEGLSGALRESLCMGVPIVASDMAGNRELLFGSDPRFLFPPGDARALAERIEWVMDHGKEVQAAVTVWRKKLDAEFSVEQMVARTAELYLRLLRQSS